VCGSRDSIGEKKMDRSMNPPQSPDTIARPERIEAKVVVANEQKEAKPSHPSST